MDISADDTSSLRLLLPSQIRNFPADLTAVLVLVFLADFFALAPLIRETPLRIVFGLPLVLFLPGYALIAALFPEDGSSPTVADEGTDSETADDGNGIDGIERVALSFGLSIAIVPLIGLVLNFTPWGIRLVPILLSITGVTVPLLVLAARRRQALPEDERFRVPYQTWFAEAQSELFEPDTRTDLMLNVLLVFSVLLAAGSVGYAVAVPKQGEAFTEFYLLTENEDGELVADDYPTEFTIGEQRSLVVGIGNHEHETVSYTIVVKLQRVSLEGNETIVRNEREVDRFDSPALADNETWHRTHAVAPTMTGERLRLAYLLYRSGVPAEPSVEDAYRETHLWVNVTTQ